MIAALFASCLLTAQIPPDLKEWVQRFGSPSPLQAINKTVSEPLRVLDSHIEQILKGKTTIKYSKPFVVAGRNVLEFDIFEDDTARRFELSDPYSLADVDVTNSLAIELTERRFSFMLNAFYKLLSSRKDDELLLIHMGLMHALDVYLNFFLQDPDKIRRNPALQRRREIIYMNHPLDESMQFQSEDFYMLRRALDGVDAPRQLVKDSAAFVATNFLARLHYFNDLKKDAITVAALKDETLSRLGVIVFMDMHYLESTGVYKAMPTADALRRSGFKSVKLATEAFLADKEYSLDDLNRIYRTPNAQPIRDYELTFLQKKAPQIRKKYISGDLIMGSAVKVLHEKLKSYKRGGLNVSLTGLEEEDRFTQGIIDTSSKLTP